LADNTSDPFHPATYPEARHPVAQSVAQLVDVAAVAKLTTLCKDWLVVDGVQGELHVLLTTNLPLLCYSAILMDNQIYI
jgi:hypothetical protein